MGSLNVPDSGIVDVDANCIIYGLERIEPYSSLLQPLWNSAAALRTEVVTSELSLMEALVKPIRDGNRVLQQRVREFLGSSPEIQALPSTIAILEEAARIRAETTLRTPDAIHVATALRNGASLLVTNDVGLRNVPGLPTRVLCDILG